MTEQSTTSLAGLIQEPFSDFVRAIRREFGLNQVEAAEAFGVSQATVCRWEQGAQRPILDSLQGCVDLLRRYKAARAAAEQSADDVASLSTEEFVKRITVPADKAETADERSATFGRADFVRDLRDQIAEKVWSFYPQAFDTGAGQPLGWSEISEKAREDWRRQCAFAAVHEGAAARFAARLYLGEVIGDDHVEGFKLGERVLHEFGEQLRKDKAARAADEQEPAPTLPPGISIPLRRRAPADLEGEGSFLTALDVYDEAIAAHRKLLTRATAETIKLARQGVVEAHLAGAQLRAVGLAEAMRAWNAPIQQGVALRAMETERDAWKAHAFFWKDKAQDRPSVGEPTGDEIIEAIRHHTSPTVGAGDIHGGQPGMILYRPYEGFVVAALRKLFGVSTDGERTSLA